MGGFRWARRAGFACAVGSAQAAAARAQAATGCLLTPVHPPHFHYLRRLLWSVLAHAEDRAPVYVLFDTESDERHFKENTHPGLHDVYLPLAYERVLERLDEQPYRALVGLGANRSSSPGRCLVDWVRVYQALKKLLGVAHLAGSCHTVWVVDSESAAFADFSFARVFADVKARRTVTVHRARRNGTLHQGCTLRLMRSLKVGKRACAQLGSYNKHGDWWAWEPRVVMHMLASARATSGRRFSQLFLAAPAPANSVVAAWIHTHRAAFPEYALLEVPMAWERQLQESGAGCGRLAARSAGPGQPKALGAFLGGFPLQRMSTSGWSGACAAHLLVRLAPIHAFDSYTLLALLALPTPFMRALLEETGVSWCTSNCGHGLLSAVGAMLSGNVSAMPWQPDAPDGTSTPSAQGSSELWPREPTPEALGVRTRLAAAIAAAVVAAVMGCVLSAQLLFRLRRIQVHRAVEH